MIREGTDDLDVDVDEPIDLSSAPYSDAELDASLYVSTSAPDTDLQYDGSGGDSS